MSEITLLTKTEISWPTLLGTVDTALGIRAEINSPVKFSEDAEYLITLAMYQGIQFSDPLRLLREYPITLMPYLHYTFLLACSKEQAVDFIFNVNVDIIHRDVDLDCLLIVSGTLDKWYNAITISLRKESKSTFILNKFLLIFEKRGLRALFEKYRKIPLEKTEGFLLER